MQYQIDGQDRKKDDDWKIEVENKSFTVFNLIPYFAPCFL